jgi:hypothetical protein
MGGAGRINSFPMTTETKPWVKDLLCWWQAPAQETIKYPDTKNWCPDIFSEDPPTTYPDISE